MKFRNKSAFLLLSFVSGKNPQWNVFLCFEWLKRLLNKRRFLTQNGVKCGFPLIYHRRVWKNCAIKNSRKWALFEKFCQWKNKWILISECLLYWIFISGGVQIHHSFDICLTFWMIFSNVLHKTWRVIFRCFDLSIRILNWINIHADLARFDEDMTFCSK